MIGIYKITDKDTGLVYIGQSRKIEQRLIDHTKRHNTLIDSLIYQKGKEHFKFEIIEECTIDMLNDRERYWINYYNSYENGLNQTFGGAGIPHNIKLDKKSVSEIQDLLMNSTISQLEIAKRFHVSKDFITDINLGRSHYTETLTYPLRLNHRPQQYCSNCGKALSYGNKTGLCKQCVAKVMSIHPRVVERPSKEQLLKEIATSSFVKVSQKYGVSDKAIVKWCKVYGLPTHKKDLVELYKKNYLK